MGKKKKKLQEASVEPMTRPEAIEQGIKIEEIKEDDLDVKPLQTFAKSPEQPFNKPKVDAPLGVGGSYYIDSTGTRVKRT